MSNDPRIISVRTDAVLLDAASAQKHKWDIAGLDQGVFMLKYTPGEIAAILSIKLSFAKSSDELASSDNWYSQMFAPDDAVSVLEIKEYTYVSTVDDASELISLSLPLMDKAVRIEVSETSTTKGNLQIEGVGTILGQH